MHILYGSQDSGPRNYFYKLFKSNEIFSKEFINEEELIIDLRYLIKSKGIKPIILTGTSLGSNTLDKKAILIAKKFNLKCFSIIDHWTWFRKRFERGKDLLLPDKILVNDSKAKNDAIKEGLPSEKIEILGNPVLENHSIRSLKIHKKNNERIKIKHRNFSNQKFIFFISESLEEFRVNEDLLGFDEYIVFDLLKKYCKNSNSHLLIKPHPSDLKDKYGIPNKIFSYVENIEVDEMAILPHKIVGMGSMFLLELAIYRDDIISLRPNANSPFIGDLIDVTIAANDLNSLEEAMKSKARGLDQFRSNYIGSTRKILDFLKSNSL